MLDPASASDQLRNYESNLGKELNIGQCILLRFLFPDEGRLAMVLRWLNSQANLHVWEIAHRIPPPEFFYKAHPEILEACKLCGAVIFDAATPSTWARTMESFLARTIPNLRVVVAPCWAAFMRWSPALVPMPCKQSSNRGPQDRTIEGLVGRWNGVSTSLLHPPRFATSSRAADLFSLFCSWLSFH